MNLQNYSLTDLNTFKDIKSKELENFKTLKNTPPFLHGVLKTLKLEILEIEDKIKFINLNIFLKSQIKLCEGSKLYSFAEFYRNILKNQINLSQLDFKNLINLNIKKSNVYYLSELLSIKNKL